MSRVGVDSVIATLPRYAPSFGVAYPHLDHDRLPVIPYENAASLAELIADVDVVIATVYTSVVVVNEALALTNSAARPAYYVQDYEPLFCDLGSPEWTEARESYTLIPNQLLFAKTDWLCDVVFANHGVPVKRVPASVDHAIYHPDLSRRRPAKLNVCAMLRPSTPRRAPARTARIFNWLASDGTEPYRLHVFGVDQPDLVNSDIQLDHAVQLHGHLRRDQVAALLRRCDVFLDASDYQAFGRTGIEAMASGCVPVLPAAGGAQEFVVDGVNGLLVDTASDKAILDAISWLAGLSDSDFGKMRMAAIRSSREYSVEKTAIAEIELLMDGLA